MRVADVGAAAVEVTSTVLTVVAPPPVPASDGADPPPPKEVPAIDATGAAEAAADHAARPLLIGYGYAPDVVGDGIKRRISQPQTQSFEKLIAGHRDDTHEQEQPVQNRHRNGLQ